jgi:predicted TIM-barrel fold metal-dependent hydrolase
VDGLRRAVTGISAMLRRQRSDDYRKGDVFDAFETLRIFLQADTRRVADWLMREIPPGDACVPLMMDITNGDGADNAQFAAQLEDTSSAARAYPGRLLPFVFANPLRPGFLDVVKNALEKKGFLGVKLYPSLGYSVDQPALEPLYEHCLGNGIPLLTHCSQGGFIGTQDGQKYADPELWRPVLARHPGLKVCFAHFGGGPDQAWAASILKLMKDHPGVYSDIAFHRTPMEGDDKEKLYFARMADYLREPAYRERILFGTDFWLIRPRLSEPNHWRYFESRFDREGKDFFHQIAEVNPGRFLGLPGHGANKAVEHYADFIAADPKKIESPPARWVVDLIRARQGAAVAQEVERSVERVSPSRSLVVRGWNALERKVQDLKDTKLDEDFDLPLQAETSSQLGGSIPIGLTAAADFSIQLFNQRDQNDPDGIVLPRSAGAPAPPLTLEPGRSWLKYKLEGKLAAHAGTNVGKAGLKIDLGAGVTFTDYRVHDRKGLLREALLTDLRSPRFAIRRADVMRLRDGEALSFAARGTLAAEVTLTWSDAFAVGLGQIANALGSAGGTLGLTLDAGATVSARVEKEDDFMVVFARLSEGFRVSLRKTDSRKAAVAAKVSGALHFSDPAGIRVLADGLIEDAPGVARKAVLDSVEGVAKRKIEAGFDYEYSRLETRSLLLEAFVDPESLDELHEDLVQGDGSGLLDRIRGEMPGVELVQYLRQREVVRRQAWGFTLGRLSGQDVQTTRFVEQLDLHGNAKRSFLGTRGYTGKWLRNEDWKWLVDLKADMADFQKPSAITTRSFSYGLALMMEWEREVNQTSLAEVLDAAAIWGALPDGVEAERARLADLKLIGKPATVRVELTIDHGVLAKILPAQPDPDATAKAFARAMPWHNSQVHSEAKTRERLYAPVWKYLLEASQDPGWDLDARLGQMANMAADRVRPVSAGMAAAETMPADQRQMWTFAGLLDRNRQILTRWAAFHKGLALLGRAVAGPGDPPEAVHEMFARMEDFWRQAHHVRAAGAWLLARADSLGLRREARATLKIDFKSEGVPKSRVVGST